MSSVCSSKWPPKLNDENEYENWKKDIEIWCELSDLPETKQALAIHLSLTGRARVASSELSIDILKAKDGVKKLLEKLDALFLHDAGRRQFSAFHELYNLRRNDDMNINEFVSHFDHIYFKFNKQGMELPDPVIAFMLLASCKLSDTDVQLVMSAITEVTSENMKSVLKRVFGGNIGTGKFASFEIKTEPVFHSAGESSETFYANSRRGQYQHQRGTYTLRGRGNRGDLSNRPSGRNNGSRKTNPVDRDGNISRCVICESKFHWARQCPDAYENVGSFNNNSNESPASRNEDENVQLSLFMEYANVAQSHKLRNLVGDSYGSALLDTGCSTTVCGVDWLENYSNTLSVYDKESIKEEPSSSSFTFGDGATVTSLKRVTIPCYISGMRSTIETDVVTCKVPLLLSKKAMKRGKMCLNFETDTVVIEGKSIVLNCTLSSHYLLHLSM